MSSIHMTNVILSGIHLNRRAEFGIWLAFFAISCFGMEVIVNKILDRIILILLLSVSIYPVVGLKTVYVILVGIIFSFLSFYLADTGGHMVLMILLGIVIVINTIFMPLLVLMLYEVLYRLFSRDKYGVIVMVVIAGILLVQYLCGMELLYIRELRSMPVTGFMFVLDSILASYLSYLSVKEMVARENNIKMRDENEEFRQLMLQKNALQRQQQDNEISMATLRERNRIAREIHDNVGHLLSRSILQMGALQTIYKEEPVHSSLKQVSVTLDEAMANIRSSVHNLHNEAIDLKKTIQDIIERNQQFTVTFDYDVDGEIFREIKYCIISVITEAFENVKKHSDGTEVEIIFAENPGFYKFIFRDNGSPKKIKESGIGLHNMQSRVEEFGGTIEFMVDNGFKIFAMIPKG